MHERISGMHDAVWVNVNLATMREEQPDMVVLDVREPSEWDDGHIAGAINVPMGQAIERMKGDLRKQALSHRRRERRIAQRHVCQIQRRDECRGVVRRVSE